MATPGCLAGRRPLPDALDWGASELELNSMLRTSNLVPASQLPSEPSAGERLLNCILGPHHGMQGPYRLLHQFSRAERPLQSSASSTLAWRVKRVGHDDSLPSILNKSTRLARACGYFLWPAGMGAGQRRTKPVSPHRGGTNHASNWRSSASRCRER